MKKLGNRLLIFLLFLAICSSFQATSFAQTRLLPDPGPTLAQRFGRVPPPGVHPRLLISPDQLPALRQRIQSTEVGRITLGKAEEMVGHLHGPGKMLVAVYAGLVKGDKNSPNYVADAHWRTLIPLSLMTECYDDLLHDDRARGEQAAAALTTFVSIPRNWSANDTDLMLIAFAYDFDYPYMTEQQRNVVRQIIAVNTAGKKPFGADQPPDWRDYNWIPRGVSLTLAALAIEGEPGYDPSIYPASVAIMKDFLHYGITQTGGGLEEMHYFHYGMANGAIAMIAFARHGDNLFSDPHYRALPNWLVASMEPYGDAFSMHQDTPASTGGLSGNYALLKWVWPNDPVVDTVWRNQIESDGNQLGYNANWIPILVIPVDPNGWHPYIKKIPRTKWGVDPPPIPADYPDPVRGIEALKLPLTYWDPERGLLITRDKWGSDGMVLHLDINAQAIGGPCHCHANSDNFTFSALERKWAIDRGFHIAETKDSSDVLIDGRGQGYGPVAGKPVAYREDPGLTVVCGDAAEPYRWISTWQKATKYPGRGSFQWEPDTSPKTVHRFAEIAKSDPAHPWNDKNPEARDYYFFQAPYNPVLKAFRTAAVRRGAPHPYALIVDDIRKDNTTHQYDWLMQVADDLVVKGSNGGAIILGSSDANDNRRLLVQMIAVNGGGSWTLEKYEVKRTPESGDTASFGPGLRLRYSVRTVEPGFRVLLYPFHEGDPLPQVTSTGAAMELRWSDQQDRYTFTPLPTGRLELHLASK